MQQATDHLAPKINYTTKTSDHRRCTESNQEYNLISGTRKTMGDHAM